MALLHESELASTRPASRCERENRADRCRRVALLHEDHLRVGRRGSHFS